MRQKTCKMNELKSNINLIIHIILKVLFLSFPFFIIENNNNIFMPQAACRRSTLIIMTFINSLINTIVVPLKTALCSKLCAFLLLLSQIRGNEKLMNMKYLNGHWLLIKLLKFLLFHSTDAIVNCKLWKCKRQHKLILNYSIVIEFPEYLIRASIY